MIVAIVTTLALGPILMAVGFGGVLGCFLRFALRNKIELRLLPFVLVSIFATLLLAELLMYSVFASHLIVFELITPL